MTIPKPEERLASLMQQIGEPGTCRGCSAPIVWIKHRNGRITPYDTVPDSIGTNHFITCPKREDFKRR